MFISYSFEGFLSQQNLANSYARLQLSDIVLRDLDFLQSDCAIKMFVKKKKSKNGFSKNFMNDGSNIDFLL